MASRANVSALLLWPLVQAVSERAEDLERFWRATDLTPEMLGDPETRVSPAQFCVAWAEAIQASGDPGLALRIAEALPAGAFGVVEYVCRSAPTAREALGQWVRYLGLLDDSVKVGVVDAGAHFSVRVITESEAPAPGSHELCFAMLVLTARRLVEGGDIGPVEVRFTHAAPAGLLERYRSFFGGTVTFGAARTELLLSKSIAELRLTTADPSLLKILTTTAEAQQKRATDDPPLTQQVRRVLAAALSHNDAQLSAVAKRLGLTARSLQRRLQDEGAAFQDLREETRRSLADRYLVEGRTVAEISFLLGFSEPSAFFRAFKRWTGFTPIERRDLLSRQA